MGKDGNNSDLALLTGAVAVGVIGAAVLLSQSTSTSTSTAGVSASIVDISIQ